jgi:hypothetical protein
MVGIPGCSSVIGIVLPSIWENWPVVAYRLHGFLLLEMLRHLVFE